VLQPLNSKLISRPAVVADSDNLVARDVFLVLGREVVLASKDNSLDHRHPLAIARLNSLWSASSL
jgi:hypothetical protein